MSVESATEFASELSWKIFLDRYTQKDLDRRFQAGDLAVVLVEPHPKWPKKDIGVVREVLPEQRLKVELLTGPQAGTVVERGVLDCDRPTETTLAAVAGRIATGVAAVEADNVRADVSDLFTEEIRTLRFVPGGRIWAGAGTGQQLTYFNCYVLPNPKDSREGIVDTLGQMIEIMSRGGGVGINVSSLRPARATVRGVNGRSSGAVSWMDLYSRATGLVEQGGSRRGALMLQIEDWHPDLWRFIEVKKTPGMVENANISVRVSDAFMAAVKADGDWQLVFPDTSDPEYDELWDGDLEKWRGRGKPVRIYETTKARKIWAALIRGAWEAAEPGVVFDERHEKESNSWYFNPLVCTNPCITGDTLVYTGDGVFRAEELYRRGTQVNAVLDSRHSTAPTSLASAVFQTGVKPVVRVETSEGFTIRVTRDHLLYSEARGWVPAGSLVVGEPLRLSDRGQAFGPNGTAEEGRALGWLVADGRLGRERTECSRYGDEQVPARARQVDGNHGVYQGSHHRHASVAVAEVATRAAGGRPLEDGITADKVGVPDSVFQGSQVMQVGFLQALFEADGSVHGSSRLSRVRLTSASLRLLQDVQRLLLNVGITSRLYQNRPYPRRGSHALVLAGQSLVRFAEGVGFLSAAKQRQLQEQVEACGRRPHRERWQARVSAVRDDGVEPVYDLTEPLSHSFVANGFVVHNCAEQPLPAWGVCTLGHLNLAAFYDADHHDVDWAALRRTVRMGVRFLDDIVDATPYFFEENRDNQSRERRIGMGTLGLGELLIRMGLRYGAPEAVQFIDKLYQFIAVEAYLYDAELAREKGAFPAFEADKYLESGFMRRMPDSVRDAIAKNGARNVTILTQAPTGTTGTLVGTSTGIEPFYAFTYYRQSRLGFDEQYVPIAQEWIEAHPGEPLPSYFVGAMDLTPEEHIYVQAAIQKWIDSSISKTANAPASYTVEDTARLYELAYDLGCKGVTIYRDQSRQEQVLHIKTEEPAPEAPRVEDAPRTLGPEVEVYPVPSQVQGRTYRRETPAGTARVVINEVDRDPFEVFMLLGRAGSEVQSFMEALGRVISLYLRSSGNLSPRRRLKLVADQLRGIGGANQMGFGTDRVLSVVDAIGLIFDRHLNPEGQADPAPASKPAAAVRPRSTGMDLCPECDAPTLVYEEGCMHCQSCGYSRC
jgi:ribonucleoside-diphosphate reductase alpha chain